jgi:hypothetical protein
LEKSNVRHDGSYNGDHLRIIVEQIPPILLERETNYTIDQLTPSTNRSGKLTDLLQAEKKILMIKLVLLAHLASHPLPAPSKFPVLTADAIPSEAGTWKKVLVVESKHDWAARETGPSIDAASAQASQAHHSDETMMVPARPREVTVPSLENT